jgi:SAM-dependent methyltransferase
MREVPSERYDTVLCSEVLEHLPHPERAVTELCRVLRPDGCLILSVPFLSRLHEEPNDFFRFTEHGLRAMTAEIGLSICRSQSIGGPFSFLGHQLSTLLVVALWRLPLVRWVAFGVNAIFVVVPCRLLDRLWGVDRIMPAGYVLVATRRATHCSACGQS